MPLKLTDGPSITLEQMLLARERRACHQQTWLRDYAVPLISLTLVIPGAIKKSSGSHFIFQHAVTSILALCDSADYPLLQQQIVSSACGEEALFAVNANAEALKIACIALENTHPLGRLWDIDILSPGNGILSRSTYHQAARPCLICQESAHACARARRHALPEIIQVIEEKIDAFQYHYAAD